MLQLPVYQPNVNFNQFTPFDFFGSLISFGPEMVWFLVGFMGLFFVVYSLILSYHWRKFGLDTFVMVKASLIYYIGSVILWAVIIISLGLYLKSI